MLSPPPISKSVATETTFETKFQWESTTPLGSPVVPLV